MYGNMYIMTQNFIIIVVGILVLVFLIRTIFTHMMFKVLKKSLPPISATEKDAIDAGTVSLERGLFAGKPDWDDLFSMDKAEFSPEEQTFIDGPLKQVCDQLNDYEVRSNKQIPDTVWEFLRTNQFFSLIMDKQYGGLGFSAHALSHVLSVLRSKSVAAATSVSVPNSLGPAKLLFKFGTDTQKDTYLPKLASGTYVPCFALTGITSGSDAASMRDVGIVVEHNGTLRIKATFSKRYITLAPVATLIGLAIDVYDPEGLLGDDYPYVHAKTRQVGITVALITPDMDGVEVGQRHGIAVGFLNGSIRGRDVLIDMEQVIGGKAYLGKGWVMLMACLGVGRAVTVPSGSAGMTFATYYTVLYAGIRKQFNLPIAKMEGVVEKLSHCTHLAYINDSARALSVAQVDRGENPAVSSALIKYGATEDLRTCINACMDVLAGKAVCDGPNNIIQGTYQGIPVSITVEGANILTRTLITFSQGAIRAHPYLLDEIEALYMDDQTQGQKKFASVIMRHMAFTIGNGICNFIHNVTRGIFLNTPKNTTASAKYYRMVNIQAKQFSLLSDIVLLVLGGRIRAKQMMSGRCADVLKNLYYAMATLKRFEQDKTDKALPILDYALRQLAHENIHTMHTIINNLPSLPMRILLKLVLFPYAMFEWGLNHSDPKDADKVKMLNSIYNDGAVMDNVFGLAVHSTVYDEMRADYETLQRVEPLYKKLKPFIRSRAVIMKFHTNWVADALQQDLITPAQADQLYQAEKLYYKHANVDEFSPDGKTHLDNMETNMQV